MVAMEKIADVEEGAQSDLEIGGMTAEEQAQWDAMQAGRDIPATEAPSDPEPADEEEPEPVAATDKEPEPESGRQAPKTISYGKYQREMKKREDAAAALQARLDGATAETKKEREERLRLDERTKMLLDAINAKPKPAAAEATDADPEPNGEDDPIAHAAWTGRELKRTQKQFQDFQAGQTKRETETAAQSEEQRIYNTYESDLRREAAADPTFAHAFVHLRESRYTELGYIYAGIDINDKAAVDAALTPEQQVKLSEDIQRSFHQEQMLVAREALTKGKSPAKVVGNLAKARGWKPEAATAAAVPAAKTNGAVVKPAAAARTVGDELAAIRAAQAAGPSLSDGGGSSGSDITPERLATMTEDEFDEFYNSMPKAKLDKLMGKGTLQ